MTHEELLKRSKVYTAIYDQMVSYQMAYLGGITFKQQVRKKRPSEDSTAWLDLVSNTVAQPICRYIVDTINDILFEPGVKRDIRFCTDTGQYIDPNNMSWSELFLLDANNQNQSLTSFMEDVGDLTSIFGHCWVGVDMPQADEGNQGRPYVISINPLDVWDWHFEYYRGRPMLDYVKIKEGEEEDCYYIKCYHLGNATTPSSWKSYEVPKTLNGNALKESAKLLSEGFFPPGMALPIFIAYGRRDPRTIDLGVSDIDAASDAMREHYKLECEAYSAIQFAHTLIRADKGISIPVHAGAIVRASEGQVEAIEINTGDVDAVLKKQADILEQIEALTGMGGLRTSKNQIASGVAIIEERKQLHRTAKSKARLMEVCEEMIFTFAARFMNVRWAGEVNYNTDYESHDTNYRLAIMTKAKELVPANAIIENLIAKEVIAMLAPAQEIQEYEKAFIDGIQDPTVKKLMMEENAEIYSRDLGTEIPTEREENEENESGEQINDGPIGNNIGAQLIGGIGTPTTPMGVTYYPQQAVAVQLSGMNVGR